jgi:integrase
VAAVGNKTIRDELAFGLMRRGERGVPSTPSVVNALARALAVHNFSSLMELRYDHAGIDTICQACGGNRDVARSFLLDTLDELCLLEGVEPTRRYLGIAAAGGGTWVNLNNIIDPQFRDSVLRWMTYRLNTEMASPQYTQACVVWIASFCNWLSDSGAHEWRDLRRAHMIEYLTHLRTLNKPDGKPYSAKYVNKILSGITTFVEEASANGWADIPAGVRWLRTERPPVPPSQPRLIGGLAAARLRDPESLKLISDPDCRLAIRIIDETGLRRKDVVVGLSVYCLLDLGDDMWSLRYTNSKGRRGGKRTREATTPISPDLARAVQEHIRLKREKYPNNHHLFATDERDTPLTLTIINRALKQLIETLDLRGPDGQLVTVTPHMFRHQRATDLLEAGVSLPVIQRLIDHTSMKTTEIYAHMSEKKVREEWERARAVDHAGNLVPLPGSVEADAAWLHAFMGGATQALPNGRCGMPCSETCEHANACLDCPLFITTPEYLPVLRAQRDEHAVMMKMAEAEGLQRIVERNRKPFMSLSRLIENLELLVEEKDEESA